VGAVESPSVCFEAQVAPDGRVTALCAVDAASCRRAIEPASGEAVAILSAGREITYQFDEDRALRNLPYPALLAAMRQEVAVTLHKARHGELLDEPELVPGLRNLLRDLEDTARAFAAAQGRLGADP
jgi:hypothetical protein